MDKQPSTAMALVTPPDEPLDSFSLPSSPAGPPPEAKTDNSASDISKQLLSPPTPSVTTFDLVAKFQRWGDIEFSNGRPDPILFPERRKSSEYNPLFGDQSSPRKLEPAPDFLKRDNFESSPLKSPIATSSPSDSAVSVAGDLEKQSEEAKVKEALIDNHYRYVQSKSKATKWSSPKRYPLPAREDYSVVLDVAWQSMVLKDYNSDPNRYYKRQLEENDENYYANKRHRIGPSSTIVLKPKEDKPNPAVIQVPRVRKTAKKQVDRSGTPEVKHRRTAVKKTKAVFHYDEIPDYAPSYDTIPADKTFRVVWNGQPLDLSEDPDRHMLHPAEIQLASKLRFPCAQYLKTKRRVFVGRVNNLIKYPNKQFCKTDAQQVGGVDVNKLSQLWEAYNSIGWFNYSHFKNHVEQVRNADSVYNPKDTKWVDRREIFGF